MLPARGRHSLWMALAVVSALLLSAAFAAHSAEVAERPYTGIEITVGVQNVSAIGAPARAHAATWEQRTGGKVRVLATPFRQLFDAFLSSLTATEPVYDVLLYPPAWAGDFFPYLTEVPPALVNSEAFDDIHPTYRERLMTWDGRWISVTVDGDLFQGYYRKDLFENATHQAAFRQRYGYELTPPDTWAQYRDLAEFFTRPQGGANSVPLYGTVEAFARGGQQFWDVFSRAAAYTNHPAFPGAQFFDPDTMRAQINNPGWVRAVQEYVDIVQFCPPDARAYGIVEARQVFMRGQSAMILDWGDTGPLANDPTQSRVVGQVGYFILPGTRDLWNSRTWQWERMPQPYKAPFLAFGGWVAGVPKNSRQAEAAWDYIRWYASPENSLHDVVTSGTGINPYRFTHFSSIDAWTNAFSRPAAAEYLGVLRASLDSPHAALDLRLPGFFRYTEVLEKQLTLALQGHITVQETLDQVAAEWERITETLGRAQQLALYRASMGLPPEPQRPRPRAMPAAQRPVIGFSQVTTTEPWRLFFNKELRAEADKHPMLQLIVRDGLDSVAQQVADMEELIALPADVILISPKVTEALTPVVSKAFNTGIPVIVLDRDVSNDRYTQFIGGDNRAIGRAAGRYAVQHLGGAGQAYGHIVEIWGGMASTPAHDRHQGFVEIISQEPGLRIINTPRDGDWKQDRGYELMVEVLEKHPHINLVYAHNDPMAYGAYLAAREFGRAQDIAFLGIDGIPEEGVKWVHEGILTATFLYKTPGDEGIRQALRFLQGEEIAKRLTLPTQTIDRTNAAAILRAHGLL
ncbi:MAG: extracellular solute-binding protein [Candidatus Tectimicrobiota bacterium]